MGTGGHNVPLVKTDLGFRKLTPRECFRFQGFPDTFKLPNIAMSHLYKQSGNSVSMPVIYRLANSMMEVFKSIEIKNKKNYWKLVDWVFNESLKKSYTNLLFTL